MTPGSQRLEMDTQMEERGKTPEDVSALQRQIEQLTQKLSEAEATIDDLNKKSQGSARAASEVEEIAPISELDSTLRRLVQRIAMILQADKVLMMFYDREAGELMGIPPAFGIDEDILGMVRMRATQGVSGEVFREGRPTIFHDAVEDERTVGDPFAILHVQNGVTVPLVIEKRDEENRVIDRTTIGVLHAFNKRHGEDFNDEDVRLLERMAKSAASIISNLRLYQEIVEEKEELLHTLESLSAGIVLVNTDRRVMQMNASARTIFNVGMEAIGSELISIVKDQSVSDLIGSGLEGRDSEPIEIALTTDGRQERVFQVQTAQVKSEEGRLIGAVGIFNDVTELKNIERMKSAFVATVSHELRTPLTAIKGFISTLLMDDTFPEEDRREFYTIIDHECDRLTRLINDLLNIARIEAGESLKPTYEAVDLIQLARKVVLIQRQGTAKHEIVLEAPESMPEIIGDSDKIDQILTNLVGNAVKYSPGGGKVTVKIEVKDPDVIISISDQGIGIPKDHLPKVFERFHRVHTEDNRKIYGTGLGLFLVKHLVEQIHLGKVWAESELGEGSTFFVQLPLKLDVAKAEDMNK
ncbi:MAG: GAF domain-containing protein [Fimbriimonadales bacterium]|nr:GAF domain-containing protein [Fimbriimonadales bacterium]